MLQATIQNQDETLVQLAAVQKELVKQFEEEEKLQQLVKLQSENNSKLEFKELQGKEIIMEEQSEVTNRESEKELEPEI